MKTERRHQLQTNKLADWTGHQIEQIRPHGKIILGVVILGVAIVITAIVLISDSHAAQAMAWNDFYLALAARDRDALVNVAKNHSGTTVTWWAKQAQGDIDLSNGMAALYTNRDEAFRSLNDARQAYTEVVNHGASNPELLRHSLLGVAQSSEALGDLEKARDYYLKVAQQFPETAVAIQAKSRLDAIKDPQVDKWYSWFSRQKPKPASSMLPNLPGMPDDLSKLPDKPDGPLLPLTFPTAERPAGSESPPQGPDAAKPAAAKPAAGKPAAGKAEAGKAEAGKAEAKNSELGTDSSKAAPSVPVAPAGDPVKEGKPPTGPAATSSP